MNIKGQKIELIQMLLSTTKPDIIKKIKAILEESNLTNSNNNMLTISELEKDIEESEADIKAKRVYSKMQIREHFKN